MSRANGATPVAAEHLTMRFGDFTAVDDVDLRVEAGEVVALIGANGAGKTTLIKMLLGLLRPTSGRVSVFGAQHDRELRRRIGYVPQNLGLYADLTEDENLEFRSAVFGAGNGARTNQRARSVRPPVVGKVPLGRQRQIAFAAAIGHHPDLLVLDEPTSGVSPLARSRLWDQIHAQADAGAAVLVSTHYSDEAEQADRLVIMAKGAVVASGQTADIVGGQTLVEVTTERWVEGFEALEREHLDISLDGRRIRVLGRSADDVRSLLGPLQHDAAIAIVPATLEEVVISLDARRSTRPTGGRG